MPGGAGADRYARTPVGHLPPGGVAIAHEINEIPAGRPSTDELIFRPAGITPIARFPPHRTAIRAVGFGGCDQALTASNAFFIYRHRSVNRRIEQCDSNTTVMFQFKV
jgi:hypothetical protein